MDEEKTTALRSISSNTSEYVRASADQQTLGELSAMLASARPGPAEPFAAPPTAQTTRGFQPAEPKWFMITRIIERHVGTLVAFVFFPLSWPIVGLCVASYVVRMVGLDAVYHRYFSHKTYKVGRVTQFALALIGLQCGQRGPLWWGSVHRVHHKYADTDRDPHSPVAHPVMHAGFGWFMAPEHARTNLDGIADFARYRELGWLNTYYWIPFYGVGALLFLFGELGWFGPRITGLSAFLWGFEVPVTLVFYALVAINLLTHLPQLPGGYRRYDTPDGSTNRVLLGMVTSGAGFHNNHHRHPGSARCGVAWWELDISYYFIRALQFAGLARNVRSRLSNS